MSRFRKCLFAAALLAFATGLFYAPVQSGASTSQQKNNPPLAAAEVSIAQQIPVTSVVLFNSGVGYFERSGTVEGNTKIDLVFAAENINDLLKSMVLQDMDGGKITAVSYDSLEPIERTLKGFALDLSENGGLVELLTQARGETVEVRHVTINAPETKITGRIIGTEERKEFTRDGAVMDRRSLILSTFDGVISLDLTEVKKLRFTNPSTQSELNQALETLARGHDRQKKRVTLQFTGEGKRQVKVTYVMESPMWKTTYRMVTKPDNKALLQGWAIVENTTDEDWQNVKLALVAGRPISFIMDLYEPLYVPRPTVEPELFKGLRPPHYEGPLEPGRQRNNLAPKPDNAPPGGLGGGGLGGGGFGGGGIGGGGGLGGSVEPPSTLKSRRKAMQPGVNADALGESITPRVVLETDADIAMEIGKSIPRLGTTSNLGDSYHFAISDKVTLPRQKSSLIPMLNEDIEATKVSVFNSAIHPKYPLLGLRLKNTSALNLMQGPITVFDGSMYAGDARLADFQKNETSMISYALDLGSEVKQVVENHQDITVNYQLHRGVLRKAIKDQRTFSFILANRGGTEKELVIETPITEGWKLTSEKPNEQSRGHYRFHQTLKSKETKELTIREEMPREQSLSVAGLEEAAYLQFTQGSRPAPEIQKKIEKLMDLRKQYLELLTSRSKLSEQIRTSKSEQDRLSQNLTKLDKASTAYTATMQRYNERFNEEEKLEKQLPEWDAKLSTAKAAIEDYLAKLKLE